MAFQRELGAGVNRATTMKDLLTKFVAFATSRHVATVVINVAGTGYVVGEEITMTDAGAILDLKAEVLTIGGGGDVLTLRITSNGAFADRFATAVINAGGTGYVVGDILQIVGGSAREEGKVVVDTEAAGVITAVSIFETGGAYATPTGATGIATVGIGPSTFAGDDAATVDLTYTGIVGLTANATTASAAGTGLTIDITLAESGWDSSERNRNDILIGNDFNKQVTLIGDATGKTNKPIAHYRTRLDESGIIDRFNWQASASISHNPALDIPSQVGISVNTYLSGSEDEVQEIDFWFSVDDLRLMAFININPAAGVSDDGIYLHHHSGFIDTFATETEDPYPYYLFSSVRTPNVDPGLQTTNITGLSECAGPSLSAPGSYFFRSEDSVWVNVENSENLNVNQTRPNTMFPIAQVPLISQPSAPADNISVVGPIAFYTGIGSTGRAAPTRRLMPLPGVAPLAFPIPLTIIARPGGTSVNQTLDTIRGQLRGVFWVSGSEGTGATPQDIANFAEDFITIGTDRYRVFHTHVHTQIYHYICVKEDN